MNDRAVSLLEQYDIEVIRTHKGRGAVLCDTAEGCLIFKQYTGNEERLAIQNEVLKRIKVYGKVLTEEIIPTKESALAVKDTDGVQYILKTYCEGRECNVYDREECKEVMQVLARLHECMEQDALEFSPLAEYEKRNKELKRVRKFLRQKSQKTAFEIRLLNTFDSFWEQALTVIEEWGAYEKSNPKSSRGFCHGDYQYHNILYSQNGWFLANFEKCMQDSAVKDIYLMLRKLLEKSGWSASYGQELLSAYEKQRPLSAMERIDLYYRLFYPEKFWKIANFYYNKGKSWIPERNQEKLEKLVEQEAAKQLFLNQVFRDISGRGAICF